jgi:hypothetical protein
MEPNDLALIVGAAISILIPFITGFLSKRSWNGAIKYAITIVLSLAVGFGSVLIANNGVMDWANWVTILLASIVAAKSSYWLFIEKTGLKEWLAAHGIADKPSIDNTDSD